MRVVHISTSDISGGASRAAFQLHQGLRRLGYDSSMFVAFRHSDDANVFSFRPPMNFRSRFQRRMRRERIARDLNRYRKNRPSGYEAFSDDRSQHGGSILEQIPTSDVINLHWVAGFVDYQSFFQDIPTNIPVIWTLHDMNPFTGGCHYDHGCGGYRQSCGACSQLGSTDPKDLSFQIWHRKHRVFSYFSERLYIVAPSDWLAAEARASSLFQFASIATIPNGVDIDNFAPRDMKFARQVLGIPQKSEVVLFVADSIDNRRKGFSLLMHALQRLRNRGRLFLLSVGNRHSSIEVNVPYLHLGFLNNDRLLSLAYSAADVFVIPSLQDNLPNTVLESLACGTPVVGFSVGGIPDMVRPGVTGQLVSPGDVEMLSEAIAQILDNPQKRRSMAENCRRIAVEEYSIERQARQYLQIYEQAIDHVHALS